MSVGDNQWDRLKNLSKQELDVVPLVFVISENVTYRYLFNLI